MASTAPGFTLKSSGTLEDEESRNLVRQAQSPADNRREEGMMMMDGRMEGGRDGWMDGKRKKTKREEQKQWGINLPST